MHVNSKLPPRADKWKMVHFWYVLQKSINDTGIVDKKLQLISGTIINGILSTGTDYWRFVRENDVR